MKSLFKSLQPIGTRLLYLCLGILLVTAISSRYPDMWQPPRHDLTMTGTGNDEDPLGINHDSIVYQRDLEDLGGVGTPGIDDVLAEAQTLTDNRILGAGGNDFKIISGNNGFAAYGVGYEEMGDINRGGDGTIFTVDDNNKHGFFDDNDHDLRLGINTTNPSVALDVVGDLKIISTQPGGGIAAGADYVGVIIGDLAGEFNGTHIWVNDDGNQIEIGATHVQMPSIPVFANEAAAVTGGLPTGTIYRTSTGELRIKL